MQLRLFTTSSRTLLHVAFVLLGLIHDVCALVTIEDMEKITETTRFCCEQILGGECGAGAGVAGIGIVGSGLQKEQQAVLGVDGGWGEGVEHLLVSDGRSDEVYFARNEEEDDDDGEREDTVAAALHFLDSALLDILNKPLRDDDTPAPTSIGTEEPNLQTCPEIVKNYHTFLATTAAFLRAVQDAQLQHRWPASSPVYSGLSFLQALWASRRPNEQDRSFIEQQMMCYGKTGCWGQGGKEKKNEVLRRGVEVVEWMNDVLDGFL